MNQDTRYQTTETKIREAFYTLLEESDFASITVKKLVNKAGINRTTFYLHYPDKYAMLDHLEKEIFDDLLKLLTKSGKTTVTLPPSPDTIRTLTTYLSGRKREITLLSGDNADPFYLDKHFLRISHIIGTTLTADLSPLAGQYMMAGTRGMIISFFKTWISRGFKEDPDDYVNIIYSCLEKISKLTAAAAKSQ